MEKGCLVSYSRLLRDVLGDLLAGLLLVDVLLGLVDGGLLRDDV
jgi:hypothetical protein